jgi:hypothetical protein
MLQCMTLSCPASHGLVLVSAASLLVVVCNAHVVFLLQGTLNKLRDERGAAQQAMRQHSQWLQGFREQVAHVAALQPAVASKLHLRAMDSKAPPRARSSAAGPAAVQHLSPAGPASDRADGGGSSLSHAQSESAGLSPVASSSLLPMASAGSLSLGQPLTVDLGVDQLVISLVHKSSAA